MLMIIQYTNVLYLKWYYFKLVRFLPADLFELQVKKRMFWKSQILWII